MWPDNHLLKWRALRQVGPESFLNFHCYLMHHVLGCAKSACPFPVLDGWPTLGSITRLKWIRGKPLSKRIQACGVADRPDADCWFELFAIYNDISRLVFFWKGAQASKNHFLCRLRWKRII